MDILTACSCLRRVMTGPREDPPAICSRLGDPAGWPTGGGFGDIRTHGAGVFDVCALKVDGLGAVLVAGCVELGASCEGRSVEPRAFGEGHVVEARVPAEMGAGIEFVGAEPDVRTKIRVREPCTIGEDGAAEVGMSTEGDLLEEGQAAAQPAETRLATVLSHQEGFLAEFVQ